MQKQQKQKQQKRNMKTYNMIKMGFSPRQVLVLELLNSGKNTASQMVGDLLSPVSATNNVDILVNRGFVTRKRCDKDRRQVKLKLTEKGRNILTE